MPRPAGLIREASCLAHVVPGVSLRLPLANGEHLLVSHVCLGADLDPCQLRSALVADREHGLQVLTEMITGAEIVSGLVDLGGGLYQRVCAGAAERWFTSTLKPATLVTTLRECPLESCDAADGFETLVKPDDALGLSAICIRCSEPAASHLLDEVAMGALSRCLVAELLSSVDDRHRA